MCPPTLRVKGTISAEEGQYLLADYVRGTQQKKKKDANHFGTDMKKTDHLWNQNMICVFFFCCGGQNPLADYVLGDKIRRGTDSGTNERNRLNKPLRHTGN